MTSPALSIVAPAYNEADNLGQLVKEIVGTLDAPGLEDYHPYEIVIVDDGSSDHTAETLFHLTELFDQVVGIRLARNYGQSAALAAGIDRARGEYIVTIDADLQNDPQDIPELLGKLDEGFHCVSGHRFRRRDPRGKRLMSGLQTHLAKVTGPDINDFGCTLKAYQASALEEIDLYGEGHRYIPAQLYDRGYRITEVRVNHRDRENGSSHYGPGRLIRGFVDLVFHTIWNRYGTRPMHLLGGAGFVAMTAGGAIGLVSVIQKYAFGVQLGPRTPRLMLVALLITFGLQLFVFGFLAEMLTKFYYGNRRPYRVASVVGSQTERIEAEVSDTPALRVGPQRPDRPPSQ